MGGLFHSNEGVYFIQLGGGGLFHSNGKGYSIQMGGANDYIQVILLSKLLPFAKECMIDRSNIIVQEDKALSHAFKHQNLVYECRFASSFVIEQFI
jgi:hypothetical protein